MAKFTDLPTELKLQILSHLITPTQPVHLEQWRLCARTPDIRFDSEDAAVRQSFTFLSNSVLDDIFSPFSAEDAWRILIPRAQWLVTTLLWPNSHYSLDRSNSAIVQYAPLLTEMEAVFEAKVRHVVAVISEYTHFSDRSHPNLAHLGRHRWARFMTGQISSILNSCSGLKTMDVKLEMVVGLRPEGATIHSTFDRFYNSQPFSELWDVLVGQHAFAKPPKSSFDELYICWRKTCRRRVIKLKILAVQLVPTWQTQDEGFTERHNIQPRRHEWCTVYEEDMTEFWDIPKCMKSKATDPDVDIDPAGLQWAIEHQIARRTGKQVPRKREHEATMGIDCEC